MKLGIKIAPGNAWKPDIEATRPQMVEIWYNAGRPDDYDGIFKYLADKPIDVGLHFWGTVSGFLANTSYPDPAVSKPSLALTYAAIDAAATHKCAYVNVHPDLYSLLAINFDTWDIRVTSKQAKPEVIQQTFEKNITKLAAYAASRNVVLTVETVPMRDTPTWRPYRDRSDVIDIHQMSVSVLADLSAQNLYIANDIGHTASNVISDNRDLIWRYVYRITRTLAPKTRLIHMGFIIPPYNGVDFHDSLSNPVFDTSDAIPSKTEMIELLKIFLNREDVWLLVEPEKDHVKNYFLARELLQKAGVLTKNR